MVIGLPSLLGSYRYLGIPVIRPHDSCGGFDFDAIFPDMSRDP